MSKSNETVQILRKARGLIRKGWTRYAYATDAKGRSALSLSDNASRFCASGALNRAAYELFGTSNDAPAEYLEKAARRIAHRKVSIEGFNDSPKRTKAQVLKAFTLAIELAQAEG